MYFKILGVWEYIYIYVILLSFKINMIRIRDILMEFFRFVFEIKMNNWYYRSYYVF